MRSLSVNVNRPANYLTVGRIIGSFLLLGLKPLSLPFFIVYALCGITDMLDGTVARRTGGATKFGAALDSVADFIFIVVMFVAFLPILPWKFWMLLWVAAIAVLRFLSLAVGYAKYHELAFLHTYANKATGGLMFLLPFFYPLVGLDVTALVVCVVATLSAAEELAITVRSKSLDREVRGLFFVHRGRRCKTM